MSYQDLIYNVKDRVATITLNRPERMNSISPNLEAELHRAFDEADADRAVKVIVLAPATRSAPAWTWAPNQPKAKRAPPIQPEKVWLNTLSTGSATTATAS